MQGALHPNTLTSYGNISRHLTKSGKFKNMTPVSTVDIPQQTRTTSDTTAFPLPSADPYVQK